VERPDKAARGPDAHRKFLVSSSAASKPSKQPLRGNGSYYGASDLQTPVQDNFNESDGPEKDWEMQELGRAK